MLSAKLLVRGGKHDGRAIPLPKGRFLIGREQDCNLRPNSDLVSRHHCVFHVDDYTVRLRDLGSTNGTLVNGDPLNGEKSLKAGDRVVVGRLNFEVALSDVAEAPTPPPADQGELDDTGANAPGGDGSTTYEIPATQPGGETRFAPGAGVPPGGDTGMAPIPPQFQPQGQPGQPQGQPGQQYPPPGYGYPQQYPPPGYGYPQQYPPQPYGYPQQGYPQQGYPPQQAPQPAGPGAGGGGEAESKSPPVKLPPPPQK